MLGAARRIFSRVIVETAGRYYFADTERPFPHDCHAQFAPWNVAFEKNFLAKTPALDFFLPGVVAGADDAHANRRPLISGLDDEWRRQRIVRLQLVAARDDALNHR